MPIDPNTGQQLLDTIYEIHSAGDHTSFSERVVAGLSRLIAADVVKLEQENRHAATVFAIGRLRQP